jgi:hypothetical protein
MEILHDHDDLEAHKCVDITSMELLLSRTKDTASLDGKNAIILALTKLDRSLTYLNDFVSVLAITLGMDSTVIALIWGSIRLLLMVCVISTYDRIWTH